MAIYVQLPEGKTCHAMNKTLIFAELHGSLGHGGCGEVRSLWSSGTRWRSLLACWLVR